MKYRDNLGREFATGLIPSDSREVAKLCGAPRVTGNIPRDQWREVDYRDHTPKIYDQAQQGSCVGHGGVGALATVRVMHGQARARLSACNLYGQINGGRDQGAQVIDALKALSETGACLESTVGPGKWQPSSWPTGWKAEAARFRIRKAEAIQGFDAIVAALLEGDPVTFGIFLGGRFDVSDNGIVPEYDGGQSGGHCMYAVGVKLIGGRWYLIVVNSWGEDWGDRGHCYLPESYFRGWHEAYRVKVSVDDPQGDNPPAVKA